MTDLDMKLNIQKKHMYKTNSSIILPIDGYILKKT